MDNEAGPFGPEDTPLNTKRKRNFLYFNEGQKNHLTEV